MKQSREQAKEEAEKVHKHVMRLGHTTICAMEPPPSEGQGGTTITSAFPPPPPDATQGLTIGQSQVPLV